MQNDSDVPMIVCKKNGPFFLYKDKKKYNIPFLVDENGKNLCNYETTGLCRCGKSKNKPFCDGTHVEVGFSSEKETDGRYNRRRNYVGKDITIHDNRAICAHAAHCVNGLSSVFRKNVRPWIDPDGATVEEIASVISKCPSGALSYSVDGVENRNPNAPREPQVIVKKGGPYEVVGGIELVDVEWGADVSHEHYTLCRCGKSKNKPFCDGTHSEIEFDGD